MGNRIVYGTDTGSIEDFDQCVVLDLPDGVDEPLEIYDLLEQGLLPYKHIVVWEDLVKELKNILWEVPHMHPARPPVVIRDLAKALGIRIETKKAV